MHLSFAGALLWWLNSCSATADLHSDNDETPLLQVGQHARSALRTKQSFPLPLAWLHVPKTGQNFIQSLLNIPGACNISLVFNTTSLEDIYPYPGAGGNRVIMTLCSSGMWIPPQPPNSEQLMTHWGINKWYESDVAGHGIMMLRQPEQRIMSGWTHVGQRDEEEIEAPHSWMLERPPKNAVDYALAVSGCAVKMLTRTGEVCGDFTPASDEETSLAIHRLETGFPFIGIVEYWAESICLLHKMYGGSCDAAEISNVDHAGESQNATTYDTTELHGFIDKQDGALYDTALQIFRARQNLYNASIEGCSLCFKQAGIVA